MTLQGMKNCEINRHTEKTIQIHDVYITFDNT
jgi:hypothetical protein